MFEIYIGVQIYMFIDNINIYRFQHKWHVHIYVYMYKNICTYIFFFLCHYLVVYVIFHLIFLRTRYVFWLLWDVREFSWKALTLIIHVQTKGLICSKYCGQWDFVDKIVAIYFSFNVSSVKWGGRVSTNDQKNGKVHCQWCMLCHTHASENTKRSYPRREIKHLWDLQDIQFFL